MTSIRSTLIAASLLVGFAGLAVAQTAPHSPMGEGHGAQHMVQKHAKMEARHAKHLADLKSKLKLSADQEGAWDTFSQSMQPPALRMRRPDHANFDKLTTPERIDQMQMHKAERDAHMQKMGDATKAFYASLNADQKKVFDAETLRAMKHMKGGKHGDGDHHARH